MTATKLSKSLRSFFSARLGSNNRRKPASSRLRIPDEIVLEIVKYISSPSSILDLSAVSCHMRLLLLPRIYTDITIRTSEQCHVVLASLARNPNTCRQVRTLIVDPFALNWASCTNEEVVDESWTAKAIEDIAAARFFTQLEHFGWHGETLPPDSLWATLRTFCPNLNSLECSIAQRAIMPSRSTLYEFSNLSHFSLSVRKSDKLPASYNRHSRVLERLPESLWDMLIHRCPRLTTLTIDGSHSLATLWDMEPMLQGHWPHLKSLAFDMDIMNHLKSKSREQGHFYTSFLLEHSGLQDLRVGPEGLASLSRLQFDDNVLPSILSLSGPLPHNHYRIQCLVVPEMLRVFRVPSELRDEMWDSLRALPALASLSISLQYREQDDDDYAERIHELLRACPRLEHLDLAILPHIVVSDFSRALRDSKHLRSFTLTTVRKVTDEDLSQSAARLARQHPNLESFSIRYARLWGSVDDILFKSKATFEVVRDVYGNPSRLLGREAGYRYGKRVERRSCSKLGGRLSCHSVH
ncbi:hypothetical protein HGRIS_003505 [Hohenbuehelia grisea]|uniref:F-box domain-containing protein n=1 Tax=Hohenbuehelia grisea TaxID=104357 RepID=A0ABR3JGG8_9AGAR